MPDHLNIPEDLASLIEKREAEEPRRQQQIEEVEVEQRSGKERRQADELTGE